MPHVRPVLLLLVCGVLASGAIASFHGHVLAHAAPRIELHRARTAETDLEVRGVATDGPRFVTRQSLESLPQVEAVVLPDENFTELPKDGVKVRGVELGSLERALGAAAMSVEGVCSDGYAAPFPAEYVKQHHPILVLTIEGTTPGAYSDKTHTADMGPYFVAYDNFVPAFHVLSHEERPQVPVQMVRLEFAPERKMFAGILPGRGSEADVIDGYKIAQQNCFRCHNAAGYGGTKAGRSWQTLAKDARDRPEWFRKWVHDPQSVDAKAEMPPNPKYDRATLTALAKYFSTMK